MIDILSTVIPVCSTCNRVMVRQKWDSDPQAFCTHCLRVHHYDQYGNLRGGRWVSSDLSHTQVAAIEMGKRTGAEMARAAKAGTR